MAPATVLLIDSDADSIAIYSLILRHHGYEVLHALDGETGLRMAAERQPDLVVSEMFLPPLSGGAIVTRLREDARTADTPLIVLDSVPNFSASLGEEFRDLRRLRKPCEPTRLLSEIEQLLQRPLSVTH